MVLNVDHKELNVLIEEYYKNKTALFVFGAFGIGKSFVVKDSSEKIAKNKKKEFVEWNRLTKEKKQEVYDNPDKYFVFIDIRLSEFDSSDVKGLPDFRSGKESIEWRVPFWAKFLTLDKSDGVLFFDEINLATPLVISSVYKIVYDRIVDESAISKNWLILGAGNREEDRAYTHSLPAPVRDRGGEVELTTPNIEVWSEWATKQGIDARIIAFANFKPSVMNNVDFNSNQKFTTVRGLERLSGLIKGAKANEKKFELLSCSAIGEGIAREFISFSKIQEKFNLEDVIKNPHKIKDIEDISTKYFLVTAVAERYKDKKVKFSTIMDISKELDKIDNAEFVALLWKLSHSYSPDFKVDFANTSGADDKLIDKYAKYII